MPSEFRLIARLLRFGYDPFQALIYIELAKALRTCRAVLDVGCGAASPLRLFRFERLVGIEGYPVAYQTARRNATHHDLVLGDVRHLDQYFQPNQFDASVALDLIEHLEKPDGLSLVRMMESVSRKVVVFFTPNGFLPQQHAEYTDLQEHLSGWEPEEMRRLGYQVIGMLGPKTLRGPYHVLRHRPKLFWGTVSLLAHFARTRRKPEQAAAILCTKRKSPGAFRGPDH